MTPSPPPSTRPASIEARQVSFWYGSQRALGDVELSLPPGEITALIGPSGCGKSTFLRLINRMSDLVPDGRVEGTVLLDGVDVHGAGVDPVRLRRQVGMVFQRPNPFPASVHDNVAYGPRVSGVRRGGGLEALVEGALRAAGLWEEVAGRLDAPASSLSMGQQQRLCIARALANTPRVLLMDEPTSALDPIATARIEALIHELRGTYTVVVATHNLQQASRVSDNTGFFHKGELVEIGETATIFTNPRSRRTEAYLTGRFG